MKVPFAARSDLEWVGDEPNERNERSVENLRTLAIDIEAALAKNNKGVSLTKPIALVVKRALFDLADRIETD